MIKVFEEGELDANVVCVNFAHTTKHGAIEGKEQIHEIPFSVEIHFIDQFEAEQKKLKGK